MSVEDYPEVVSLIEQFSEMEETGQTLFIGILLQEMLKKFNKKEKLELIRLIKISHG